MNGIVAQWYERALRVLLAAHAKLHLLRSGIELGLFEAMRVPKTAHQIERELRLAPDLLQAWLGAARAQRLIRIAREPDRAYEVCGLARFLIESPRTESLVAWVRNAVESHEPVFETLPELLRGAERPIFGGAGEPLRAAQSARLVEPRALEALARVPGVRGAKRILDIGCGQGAYLCGLLLRYRDARGVGVEMDVDVAAVASRNLEASDLVRRAEIRVGDFMSLEFASGEFDLIMLNNNLYYFAPGIRDALFERVRSRLSPRGVFAIQIPVVSESPVARYSGFAAVNASFDLFLRAHSNLYALPDLAELRTSLRGVGFDSIGEVPFLEGGSARYVWACVQSD